MYKWLSNVFLSSGDFTFPSLTAVDAFTYRHHVSSICPSFTGYDLPSQYYNILDNNVLFISTSGFASESSGTIDIIFFNQAGYTKLSDSGVVLSISNSNYVSTIGGLPMTTIDGNYIVNIA